MEVEYTWLLNGTVIKEGRKSFLLYVNEPGTYQCVVKVNDNEQKTVAIEIVEKAVERNSGYDKNPLSENTGSNSSDNKHIYIILKNIVNRFACFSIYNAQGTRKYIFPYKMV